MKKIYANLALKGYKSHFYCNYAPCFVYALYGPFYSISFSSMVLLSLSVEIRTINLSLLFTVSKHMLAMSLNIKGFI